MTKPDMAEKRFWSFPCDCGYEGWFEGATLPRGHEPVLLRCRACKAEALVLTCQSCNYLCIDDKLETRPRVWTCPECSTDVELGPEFWIHPIPLLCEDDMPAEMASRFKPQRASNRGISATLIWVVFGVCLLGVVIYAIWH